MDRMNLEFKKKWLQVIFDFAQMDLNSLPRAKLRGLAVEASYFSSFGFIEVQTFEQHLAASIFDKLPEIQIDNVDWNELARIRKDVADKGVIRLPSIFSDEEIAYMESPEGHEEALSTFMQELQGIQEALRDFFKKIHSLSVGQPSKVLSTTRGEINAYEISLPDSENRLDYWFTRGVWQFKSVPKTYTLKDWAILNLANLMDSFPFNAIRVCEGCGRDFLNVTRREKFYCSPACASRSGAHRRYEELRKNPKKYEAHLKKHRKYSAKRYRKLRIEMYGPNVKIQKRNNRKGD